MQAPEQRPRSARRQQQGLRQFSVPIPAGATVSATTFHNGTVDGSGAVDGRRPADAVTWTRARNEHARLGQHVHVLDHRERVARSRHAPQASPRGNGAVALHVATAAPGVVQGAARSFRPAL